MKRLLVYLLAWIFWIIGFSMVWSVVYAQEEGGGEKKWECVWIKLNTDFPLIGNCIEIKKWWSSTGISPQEAFPTMIAALTKIVMEVILVVCLILIIVWGIMIASDNKMWQWKNLIKKVAIVILLLWFSSLILKLINPNFFGSWG